MILVLNECLPGMELSPHVHDDFDQIATFLTGRALYHVDGKPHEVGPNSLRLIPAGQMHYIEPLGDEPVQNLDVFAPARSDYDHLLSWMRDHGPA
jgi:mannose-6-phosphate isomerase-like protein (cupin superfamily)